MKVNTDESKVMILVEDEKKSVCEFFDSLNDCFKKKKILGYQASKENGPG